LRLIDAPSCPYCARVRIVLAEKGIAHEVVQIDLERRPVWIYELTPTGRVPILDDGFWLPESDVIMEYLEELRPDPPLLPSGGPARARARLLVRRFDDLLGDDYYALRRGEPNELARRLETLEVEQSLYADIAYVPWVIRIRDRLGVELPRRLADWLAVIADRPSVAAEIELVGAL
jgi:stringent starvation protein A